MTTEASDNRLTIEQQRIVSDNHNLIYKYIIKNGIDIEEYYDILCIGICKAAKIFDESKGAFSTIAFKCMENEVNSYNRSKIKQSAIPETLIMSYDATMQTLDGYDLSISEFIAENCFSRNVFWKFALSEFENNLTENEKLIVSLLLDGMSQTDIANIIGCKKQNINYHMKKIREKARKFLL